MTRPRGPRALLASLLALLLAALAVAQPLAATAQVPGQAQSRTAGSATVSFGPSWQYDPDISDVTSAFLSNTSLPGVLYIYGEIADATVTDPAVALEQFATGFFSSFGDGDEQLHDSGTLASDPSTAWHLYAVTQSGIPYGMLITGSTSKVPGSVVTSMLLSPVASFADALQSAKDEIAVDGVSPFADADGAQLAGTLQGGGPVAGTTPAGGLTLPPLNPGTTPATETPAGGLTLPPLNPGTTPATETPAGGLTLPPLNPDTTPAAGSTTEQADTVVVGGVTVTFGAPWTYEPASSSPDEIAFFSHATGPTTLFGYARTPSASADAQASLTQFTTGFFNSFGATDVQQVRLETLPSGRAWSLITGDQDGTPIALLSLADVTTDPSEFRVQVILAPTSAFPTALPDAQATIQVDGQPALNELNPATVLSLLGGGAAATAGGTAPASIPNPGSVLSVTGDTTMYEAQDAQAGCDAIGWAATGPEHIPTTEQDLSYRSSCVGGGTFFAACGMTAPTDLGEPEPGMVWVQCDVSVRVDGAPMTLTMFDFELSDATGAVYTFDIVAALAAIQNVQLFPEEAVPTGQTVTGSVLFNVPATAGGSGPWLLSINPESLQAAGGQPGTIVIAGDLQPFATAGE